MCTLAGVFYIYRGNIRRVSIANEEHLKILKQGVEAWNKWREKNPQITPDLSKADLYKANLSGVQDLTAKQLITTINWQEAILDSSLRVEAEKLIGKQKNR